jgi:hypothetical protein
MCLYLPTLKKKLTPTGRVSKRQPKREPLIATKAITVYKEVRRHTLYTSFVKDGAGNNISPKFSNMYTSLHQNFIYALGYTYKADMHIKKDGGYDAVFQGLHSFKSKPKSSTSVVLECVIPIGATYYIGTGMSRGEMASSQLTIVREVV